MLFMSTVKHCEEKVFYIDYLFGYLSNNMVCTVTLQPLDFNLE